MELKKRCDLTRCLTVLSKIAWRQFLGNEMVLGCWDFCSGAYGFNGPGDMRGWGVRGLRDRGVLGTGASGF